MSLFRRKTASDKPKANLPSNISDDPGAPEPGEEVTASTTAPINSKKLPAKATSLSKPEQFKSFSSKSAKSILSSNISDDPGAPEPGEEVPASTNATTNAKKLSAKATSLADPGQSSQSKYFSSKSKYPGDEKVGITENAATKVSKVAAQTVSSKPTIQKKRNDDHEVDVVVTDLAAVREKEDDDVVVVKVPTSIKKTKKKGKLLSQFFS
jgi:hypothetical protein